MMRTPLLFGFLFAAFLCVLPANAQQWTADTTANTLTTSARVGIGTPSPGALLHIYQASGNEVARFQSASANPFVSFLDNLGGTNAVIQAASGGDLMFTNNENGGIKLVSNGNEGLYQDSAGNVGIGTTIPRAKLNVLGNIATEKRSGGYTTGISWQGDDAAIGYYNQNGLLFGTVTTANGGAWSEKMRLTNAGNVGIGTTDPDQKLSIEDGQIMFQQSTTNQFESGRIRFTEFPGTSYQGAFIHYDGSENVFNIGVHHTDDETTGSDTNAISILRSNGNVGIGTDNPGYKLDVAGTINATEFLVDGQPISASGSWDTTNDDLYYTTGNIGVGIATPGAKLHSLSTGEQLRLGYDTSTYAAIRTTSEGNLSILPTGGDVTVTGGVRTSGVGSFLGSKALFSTGSGDAYLALHDNESNREILLHTDGDSYLTGGNVGIGTTDPQGILHTKSNDWGVVFQSSSTLNKRMQLFFRDSGLNQTGRIGIDISGINDNDLQFIAGSGSTPQLHIEDSGNVGIGTTNPSSKLAVDGTITSKEVVVTVDQAAWPDFVFEKDYALRPLEEVEQFIAEEGHLPEVPSAEEVAEGGVAMGVMQATLLQKIEELTLYLLEMKQSHAEETQDLKAELAKLKEASAKELAQRREERAQDKATLQALQVRLSALQAAQN